MSEPVGVEWREGAEDPYGRYRYVRYSRFLIEGVRGNG